jgi:hypothetical protein
VTRGVSIVATAALDGGARETPLANPRARKMMSRGAYLAARCLGELLAGMPWGEGRERIGAYLGVGASGGSIDDFLALLRESIVDGELSLERFGGRGLAACNPLLAFQLMNNFTLCHAAILERLGGPNAALFSRGAGTVAAIAEAAYAVASGECDRAITGGADAPTHPTTLAELAREGFTARGHVAADGAGLLALEAGTGGVQLIGAAHASGRARGIGEAIDEAVVGARAPERVDVVVIAPWGPPAEDALRSWIAARHPGARVVSTGAHGDTIAAAPALAVIAAVEELGGVASEASGVEARTALVLSLGVDGDPGAVALAREAA